MPKRPQTANAPQALERLMTVMPSERIFMIFLLAPLLMYVWEHVVRSARLLPAAPQTPPVA